MSKNNNELNAHIRAIHSEPEPLVNLGLQDEPATVQVRDRKSCEDCGFCTTSDDINMKTKVVQYDTRTNISI